MRGRLRDTINNPVRYYLIIIVVFYLFIFLSIGVSSRLRRRGIRKIKLIEN